MSDYKKRILLDETIELIAPEAPREQVEREETEDYIDVLLSELDPIGVQSRRYKLHKHV